MKFADPKSNIAFKKIFGNDNKKEILICFLNAVLDLKNEWAIKEVEILDPYQAPKLRLLKETTLDVRAQDHRGISFIVEMQVERQEHFAKRALYYASKTYVAQVAKAEDYPRLNQVIFIGILNFSIFESKHYLSRHLLLNMENYQQEIKDLELNFIELTKFKLQEKDLESIIDKWTYFIKHADNLEVIPERLKDPHEIMAAFEIADKHNWTKEELEIYEYWELEEGSRKDALQTARKDGKEEGIKKGREEGIMKGREEGIKKGREEGIKKGSEETKEEIILHMYKQNLKISEISKFTGIPEEKIKKIVEKNYLTKNGA